MSKSQRSAVDQKRDGGVKILGSDNKYPMVPLLKIHVVERPEEGQEDTQLFYNPRDLESMDSENMASLRTSITESGLHTPLIVRAITHDRTDGGDIIDLSLVAGERRFRSLLKLYEDNPLVYDWRSKTKKPAREVYEYIPCEVCYNISDEEALSLAWMENFQRQNLTIQEEIKLVERLMRRGLKQEEIAESLHTNVTWVSQTYSFRRELPSEGFQLLLDGRLSRHVAVQILSYRKEDREALLREAIRIEQEESSAARKKAQDAVASAEDDEEMLKAQSKSKNPQKQLQFKKKLAAAARKVVDAHQKQDRVAKESGTIRQGHLQRGAVAAQVAPRTAKSLTRSMVEQFLVDMPKTWMTSNKVDPITKQPYPPQLLKIVIATAQAMLTGNIDTGSIIRKVLVEEGEWEMPEGVQEKEPELIEVSEGDVDLI